MRCIPPTTASADRGRPTLPTGDHLRGGACNSDVLQPRTKRKRWFWHFNIRAQPGRSKRALPGRDSIASFPGGSRGAKFRIKIPIPAMTKCQRAPRRPTWPPHSQQSGTIHVDGRQGCGRPMYFHEHLARRGGRTCNSGQARNRPRNVVLIRRQSPEPASAARKSTMRQEGRV